MAILYRNTAGVILLRVDQIPDIDDPILAIFGENGVRLTQLKVAKTFKGIFALISEQFILERASQQGANNLRLIITDHSGEILSSEPLTYEPSFFSPHLDYSTSESFPPFNYAAYERPAQLAVLTHVANEDIFIKIFTDYYRKLTSAQNIYIIDHGSDFHSKWLDQLDGCQIIRIPKGKVDHLNIKRYVEYFQRFLLMQYRWVLSVDCDELLVHKNGPSHLRKILEEHDGVTLVPKLGLNLVQNPNLESELVLDRPISEQRTHYELNMTYAKPVLASTPSTWTLGFHYNLGPAVKNITIDNLYLIHLAFVSIAECARRNTRWKSYRCSEADELFVSQEDRAVEIGRIEQEMLLRCAASNLVKVPFELRGQF